MVNAVLHAGQTAIAEVAKLNDNIDLSLPLSIPTFTGTDNHFVVDKHRKRGVCVLGAGEVREVPSSIRWL